MRLPIAFAAVVVAALAINARVGAGDKKDAKVEEIVINDELINADLKDRVRTDSLCKTYTFKMLGGKTYQIDMKSKAVNSFLRLENPSGMEVAADDNSGGGRDARMIYRAPKTGEFTIIATSVGEAMGKFTLLIKEVIVPTIPLKLENGVVVYKGALAKTDPRYRGQKIHKLFTLDCEAGKTYQFDQVSGAYDAYLYLEDPDGAVVAEDDDSGGNLNARIFHKAEKTGRYHIVATSLSGGNVGNFLLTVRQRKD
jgi:serine protease Do